MEAAWPLVIGLIIVMALVGMYRRGTFAMVGAPSWGNVAQVVRNVGSPGNWEIKYAVLGPTFITFVLLFIKNVAPEWYKYWPEHGFHWVWFYIFGLMYGLVNAFTNPAGKLRVFMRWSLISLGVFAIGWSVVLTTWDWAHGATATERAIQVEQQRNLQQQQRRQQAALVPASPSTRTLCQGIKTPIKYTSTRTVVNPGGQCDLGLWHEGHCVLVWQAGKTDQKDAVRVCHHPNETDPKKQYDKMPVDVEAVATADTEFTDHYWLLPTRYVSVFR